MSRELNWLSIVQQADPDHARVKRHVIEYEFTSYSRGDERTHEGGMRVFRGNYDERGPYGQTIVAANALMWHGVPLAFRGLHLTWRD